jgi:hypothetical protein
MIGDQLRLADTGASSVRLAGRVHGIAVSRRAGALVVRFRRDPLATGYAVSLSLSDGRSLLLPTQRTRVSVPATAEVTVTRLGVIALRDDEAGPLTFARLPRRSPSARR